MTTAPAFAWLDGRIVPWDKCVLHARTQGAFWGANVFEGVRAYWRADEGLLRMFRLPDHLARLRFSMACVRMESRYSQADIASACAELLRANQFCEDVHITIVGYFGMGEGFDPLRHTSETGMHITAVPAPPSPARDDGIAVGVSSWRRIADDTMPPRVKTGANYHNSRLAHHEAVRHGYHTALLLNQRGTVAEAPGSCLAILRNGVLISPPGTSGVLDGITLASVIEFCADLEIPVERRELDRTEVYLADEAFLCGTLTEILPVTSVDRILIGDGTPGSLTRKLQGLYSDAARGYLTAKPWAVPVPATAPGA